MARANWRLAEHRDRASLSLFTCAQPGRPPEEEVQRYFRGLRPPIKGNQSLLVGEIDDEIVAAVLLLTDPDDRRFVHIQLIGVASQLRGADLALGDEALNKAIDFAANAGPTPLTELLVSANIHPLNTASERLFARNGFAIDPESPQPPYRQWLAHIALRRPSDPE